MVTYKKAAIYSKIGHYPDFIHVDIVDKTMNRSALDTNLSKLEVVRAYWPNHKIETHIMSNDPVNLINDNIINNSDIIYFHNEIEDKEELLELLSRMESRLDELEKYLGGNQVESFLES